jgi:hypothetical protein
MWLPSSQTNVVLPSGESVRTASGPAVKDGAADTVVRSAAP